MPASEKRTRRLKNVSLKTTVDEDTGELLTVEQEKYYSVRTTSETFYMSFIDSMSGFFKLNSVTDIKLLAKMCCLAEFNTGKVALPAATRKEIEDTFGITAQTLTNSIGRLRKLGLIRGDKGSFELNEQVFWKGDTQTRAKLLKANNGKFTIQVGFTNHNKQAV